MCKPTYSENSKGDYKQNNLKHFVILDQYVSTNEADDLKPQKSVLVKIMLFSPSYKK